MFKSNILKKTLLIATITLVSLCQPVFAAQKVSLYELAQQISEKSGYTFIFSPRVKKTRKVDIFIGNKFSGNALYEIFMSVLGVHGYTAVQQDDIILVVRKRKARQLWKE